MALWDTSSAWQIARVGIDAPEDATALAFDKQARRLAVVVTVRLPTSSTSNPARGA